MSVENPKNTLIVGFATMFFLLLTVVGVGLTRMSDIGKSLELVITDHNAHARLVTIMRNVARERTLQLHTMSQTTDPFVQDEQFMTLRGLAGEFLAAREKVLDMDLEAGERALLTRQAELSKVAIGYQRQVIALLAEGRRTEASRLLIEKVVPVQNEVLAVLDEFLALQHEHNQAILKSSLKEMSFALSLMLPLGLLAVILGGGIAAFVMGRIDFMMDRLKSNDARERAIRESMLDAVITIDARGAIESCNSAVTRLLGYTPEELIGRSVNALMPEMYRSHHDAYIRNYLRSGETTIIGAGREVVARHRNGTTVAVEVGVTEIRLGEQRLFVGVLHDITERKTEEQTLRRAYRQLEERVANRTAELQKANSHLMEVLAERKRIQDQLAYQATHDTLTALPNRALFKEHLKAALAYARRRRNKVALLFLDLDGFKQVNDTLGHDAGDELLKQLASRLKAGLREEDMVARIGGDEFTVILGDLIKTHHVAPVAQKLVATLDRPFEVQGRECTIGVSIGISIYPDDSKAPDELLRLADDAMYGVKRDGKNNFLFHRDAA